MPKNPTKDPLRTFTVSVAIVYTSQRVVKARTVRGAIAAAREGAQADYPDAEIRTSGVTERGGEPRA